MATASVQQRSFSLAASGEPDSCCLLSSIAVQHSRQTQQSLHRLVSGLGFATRQIGIAGWTKGVEQILLNSRDCVGEHLSLPCPLLPFLLSSPQPTLQNDDFNLEGAVASIRPQLVEFLSHRLDWLLSASQHFLPTAVLSGLAGVTDHREKVSVLLDLLEKAGHATWKQFAQCLCMECDLPLEMEILLMSSAGEGR